MLVKVESTSGILREWMVAMHPSGLVHAKVDDLFPVRDYSLPTQSTEHPERSGKIREGFQIL